LTVIPAVVRLVSDQQALELAIVENVQRHDLNAVDAALAYKRLAAEFALSQEEVARRVGKSRVVVANTMRLLDLPSQALDALREGKISEGHGRALLTAPGEGARRALLRRIIRDELTVREVERLARQDAQKNALEVNSSGSSESNDSNDDEIPMGALGRGSAREAELLRIEKHLQIALGTRLKLRPRRRGGQIVIDFYSPEDLQRLIHLLTGAKPHSAINEGAAKTATERPK